MLNDGAAAKAGTATPVEHLEKGAEADKYRRALGAIRRRLEKLELDHLRAHAAELAQKIESMESEIAELQKQLGYAERCAESWREDCLRMMEESLPPGGAIGLTKDGSLHIMTPDAGGAA
jgi:predicted RNase H-like nuclease (RuvC/YqgF family)